MLRGLKVQGMGLASGGATAITTVVRWELKQRVWCGRHLRPHSVIFPLPSTGKKKGRRGVALKVPRKLALRNVDTKMAPFHVEPRFTQKLRSKKS